MQTRINAGFVRKVKWDIQLTERQLGERAGLAEGHIYRLLDEENERDVMLSTVDKLHDAIAARMLELGINPPDDLWMRLLKQE